MGNASTAVLFACCALAVANVPMFHMRPLLSFDVALELIEVLVDRESDDSDLVTPVLFALFEHRLVVLHWSLAWAAPRGP